VPSERCSIEEHSIEYCGWEFSIVSSDVVCGDLRSQKALGTLPEDGNVMPKHIGATIHD
jgi:hypothetical protein